MLLDAHPSAVSSTSGSSSLQSTTLPDSSDKRHKSRLLSTKLTHTFALAKRMYFTCKTRLEPLHPPLPISKLAIEHQHNFKVLLRTNETF